MKASFDAGSFIFFGRTHPSQNKRDPESRIPFLVLVDHVVCNRRLIKLLRLFPSVELDIVEVKAEDGFLRVTNGNQELWGHWVSTA